jgi:hypothetical protein
MNHRSWHHSHHAGLLAELSELFFDAGVPALPYFIGGAITGSLLALANSFLAAALALTAESFSCRWPPRR